ncbi:MAG: M42 family metallopeptidase [Clostridiaceae bacterium]
MEETLKDLLTIQGVSGSEEKVLEYIKNKILNKNLEIEEDKMGNLIVKKGNGPEKIMISANMDTIGFITTFIDNKGYIRVSNIGEFNIEDAINKIVCFKDREAIARTNHGKGVEDIFIDFGFDNYDDAYEFIKEGDKISFKNYIIEDENLITSNYLNNRIGCYVLLNLIEEMESKDRTIYFVFSTQDVLGGRGARAAAYKIEPEYSLVLDVEKICDCPEGNESLGLGKGPVLRIMDKNLIIHHEMKEMFEKASSKTGVKLQYNISKEGSAGGNIHRERNGIKTGVISLPLRYGEMANKKDIQNIIKIVKEF